MINKKMQGGPKPEEVPENNPEIKPEDILMEKPTVVSVYVFPP